MIFKFLEISEGVREIAQQMIDNPHDWRQEDYHFRNISHPDIAIWTANGAFGIELNGFDGLSLVEKHYLNRAIKKSIANKLNTKPQ